MTTSDAWTTPSDPTTARKVRLGVVPTALHPLEGGSDPLPPAPPPAVLLALASMPLVRDLDPHELRRSHESLAAFDRLG